MEWNAQVVDAMRTTISNMVGVLPPHLFDVTVSTVGESLAQLMFSVIMTGRLMDTVDFLMSFFTNIRRSCCTSKALRKACSTQATCSEMRNTGWNCSAAWMMRMD